MTDKILSEALSIMGDRTDGEIIRTTAEKYWPGPMTWEQIVETIKAMPEDRFGHEEASTMQQIVGMLGLFGFPPGSKFEEDRMLKRLYYCPEPGCGRWSILDISDRDNQWCVSHARPLMELKHPDRIIVRTREQFEQEERARTGSNTEAPFVIENCQPHEAIRALIDRYWPVNIPTQEEAMSKAMVNLTMITQGARNLVESLHKLEQEADALGKMIAEAGGYEAGKGQNALTAAKIQEARKSAEQVWEIRAEVSE